MKGADVAMATIVQYNDWLEEEVRSPSSRGCRLAPWLQRSVNISDQKLEGEREKKWKLKISNGIF